METEDQASQPRSSVSASHTGAGGACPFQAGGLQQAAAPTEPSLSLGEDLRLCPITPSLISEMPRNKNWWLENLTEVVCHQDIFSHFAKAKARRRCRFAV